MVTHPWSGVSPPSVLTPRLRAVTGRLAVLTLGVLAAACGDSCGCEPPVEPPPPLLGPGLQVSDPAVRACDLVVAVAGDEVPALEFAAPVRGQAIPKAPRLAVSFVARADTSLVSQPIATFGFTTDDNAAPTIESARCFDGSGAPVAGTPLSLAD